MSNVLVSRQSFKNGKLSKIIKHWKTGEDLICTASYEQATVEFWNKNKIDFQWQIVFKIPAETPLIGGRNYFIDAYLPEQDLYVEIKGTWRGTKLGDEYLAKLKWEWFHKTYTNSELWNKEKLLSLGINIK